MLRHFKFSSILMITDVAKFRYTICMDVDCWFTCFVIQAQFFQKCSQIFYCCFCRHVRLPLWEPFLENVTRIIIISVNSVFQIVKLFDTQCILVSSNSLLIFDLSVRTIDAHKISRISFFCELSILN